VIKSLKKPGLEGLYLSIVKVISDKLIDNLILNREKLKSFPLKSGTSQGDHSVALTQYSIGIPSQRKQLKGLNREEKMSNYFKIIWSYT
jgi:hypothetical protein